MSNYLTTPGAALTKREREVIRKVAAKADTIFESAEPLRFVNIGVEYGASLHCLRAGSERAAITGVDKDITKFVGTPQAFLMQGDSTDPATVAKVESPIHVLLVDGGHEYHTVLTDLTLWAYKVPLRGFVICHDYHNIQTSEILRHGIAEVGPAVDRWIASVTKLSWRDLVAHDSLRVFERVP